MAKKIVMIDNQD